MMVLLFLSAAKRWSERWKLNLKYRDLPTGELEAGHRWMAERITWLVQYPNLVDGQLKGPSRIFFFSHVDYKGGPFTFLSNFYLCGFKVPGLNPHHVFSSVEEVYQFGKCAIMSMAAAREIRIGEARISTKHLASYILGIKDPVMNAYIGRAAAYLETEDPEWWKSWTQYWYANSPCTPLLAM